MAERLPLPERRIARDALRNAGYSARATDAILKGGWKLAVGETQAELDETNQKLADLRQSIQKS